MTSSGFVGADSQQFEFRRRRHALDRRQRRTGEDFPVARLAELGGQPLQLGGERLRTRCNAAKQPHDQAQPAHADPHLVHILRIRVVADAIFVALNLRKAAIDQRVQTLRNTQFLSSLTRRRLDDRARRSGIQRSRARPCSPVRRAAAASRPAAAHREQRIGMPDLSSSSISFSAMVRASLRYSRCREQPIWSPACSQGPGRAPEFRRRPESIAAADRREPASSTTGCPAQAALQGLISGCGCATRLSHSRAGANRTSRDPRPSMSGSRCDRRRPAMPPRGAGSIGPGYRNRPSSTVARRLPDRQRRESRMRTQRLVGRRVESSLSSISMADGSWMTPSLIPPAWVGSASAGLGCRLVLQQRRMVTRWQQTRLSPPGCRMAPQRCRTALARFRCAAGSATATCMRSASAGCVDNAMTRRPPACAAGCASRPGHARLRAQDQADVIGFELLLHMDRVQPQRHPKAFIELALNVFVVAIATVVDEIARHRRELACAAQARTPSRARADTRLVVARGHRGSSPTSGLPPAIAEAFSPQRRHVNFTRRCARRQFEDGSDLQRRHPAIEPLDQSRVDVGPAVVRISLQPGTIRTLRDRLTAFAGKAKSS